MGNYKVRVNSEAESREAQELFFKLGCMWQNGKREYLNYDIGIFYILSRGNGEMSYCDVAEVDFNSKNNNYSFFKTITLPELRDLVVLKRNDVNDATHENIVTGSKVLQLSNKNYYWQDAKWNEYPCGADIKPLNTRHHEQQSLNDQYAEIEQVRQDAVNHPNHYKQGNIECIDALESATIGKSGIEAVCVANVIKYLWRYEEKNGLEDVKKAQWYLERLIASMDS